MNKTNDIKPRLEEALELYTPEYQNIIENAVQQCIERGKNYSLEALAVTAKGNKVWVHTSGHAHYEQNEITRITGTIQDINEKKLAEVKLYEEQKRSIQNAKLATMGELSAGLAHEINNPLTIILGNLKYFKKHISQSDTLEAKFNTIEKSCDRIQSITKNLVNHARKSRGDDVKSISVVSIAQEAITLTELKAKQTMTDIQLNSATQGEVMCNEVEIEQVLINLINNSIDAIKELDERWVKLDLSEKDNIIVIKVIDSGRAFSKEAAAQLFEPFYTTKERGQGTGLGLSITKKILENHNSSIHIDYESKNTCFVIRMPKHT
jgi:C4-dicarboxylate-specific signal transduction histidine kinase